MIKNSFQQLNKEKASGLSFSLMIIAYVFISFLGQPIVNAIFGSGSAFVAICSTFSSLSILLVLIFYARNSEEKFFSLVNVKGCKWYYCLLSIGVSVGMLFGLGFINDLVASLFKSAGLKLSGISLNLSSPLHLVVFSFTFAVLPAVFEEFFFRGLLLGKTREAGIISATVSVALCFALYHGSVAQLTYQLIYGVILCLLFICAESVVPCIIAHFLNNFAVLIIEYFKIPIDLYNPLIISAGLVVLAVSVAIIIFRIVKKERKVACGDIKDFWLPFGLFGGGVCLMLALIGLFAGA